MPYKRLKYKDVKIKIYTDVKSFCLMPEKPFGELPEDKINWSTAFLPDNAKSTGFCTIEDKYIRLCVLDGCIYEDLLSTVSHEMGHIVEGGFKKNPPIKDKYFKKHEEKAEHYENFTMDAYKITQLVFDKIKK